MEITGFKVGVILNTKLSERGMKEIPTQMIYNYMKKGIIETVVIDGKKRIEIEEARRFMVAYLEGKITRGGKTDVSDLFKDI